MRWIMQLCVRIDAIQKQIMVIRKIDTLHQLHRMLYFDFNLQVPSVIGFLRKSTFMDLIKSKIHPETHNANSNIIS